MHTRGLVYNDMGLFTWPDGRVVVVAVCLTDSAHTKQEMEALFGDIGRAATEALAPPPSAHQTLPRPAAP